MQESLKGKFEAMNKKKTLLKTSDMIGNLTRDEMLKLLTDMLKSKKKADTRFGFEGLKKKGSR